MSYELIANNVKVTLTNIGEGLFGDYDENDPQDIPLLRFDVYKRYDGPYTVADYEAGRGEYWDAIEDASYCTNMRADAPFDEAISALVVIMNEVYFFVQQDLPIKKTCERLSTIGGLY